MSESEQAVFVSYDRGSECEEIVSQIDQALQARGLRLVRDKRDLGYKGSITEFLERIGRGSCVIVVISDKYLRSSRCMYELVEIARNQDFHDRVFPVILSDANIYDPVNRLKYVGFWEAKLNELDEAMKSVSSANLQGIREEMDRYDEIRDHISGLTSTLKDMNTLTLEMHRRSDFHEMCAAIEKKLKESAGFSTAKAIQNKIHIQSFEPETILIPAGSFWMGSLPGEGIPVFETPQHEVDLTAYRIGKYPVTNKQYAVFLRKTGRSALEIGWTSQKIPPGKENYPVTGVSWHDALAYCRWLSNETKRRYVLPSEAQWEKACRGGKKTYFPWGEEFDASRCNQGQSQLAAVDRYPAQNEYGGFDFVGNVRQWTSSLWGTEHATPDPNYAYPWQQDDGRNDLEESDLIWRVLRGSSFSDVVPALRCSYRCGDAPQSRGYPGSRYGFRVAMILE